MYHIETTPLYDRWFARIRDKKAKVAADTRVRRLSLGNPGDVKFVGGGVLELRLDFGPGYRIYYMRKKELVILLLVGGDKSTQDKDIKKAAELARQVRSEL
jgi:putative addiction module killer protein